MWNTVKRGRIIVATILGLNAALILFALSAAVILTRHDMLPRLLLRTAVNASAMYGLWCGVRWVRWLYVLGFSVATYYCLQLAVFVPIGWAVVGWFFAASLLALWGGLLAFSDSVNDFFKWQRGQLKPIDPEG
jgi:hypothetical protein